MSAVCRQEPSREEAQSTDTGREGAAGRELGADKDAHDTGGGSKREATKE
jgi:hypothetical protein